MAYLTRLLSALLGFLCFGSAAHAEPVTSIIGAIAGAISSYGAVAAAVVSIASSAYASSQAKKKARQAAARKFAEDVANLRDRTTTVVSSESPWPTIYGSPAPVGGSVVAVLNSGPMDQYKHVLIVFAAHECEAIDELFIDGTSVGRPNAAGWTDGPEFQMPPLFTGWPSEGPAVNVQFHTSPGGVDTADAFMRASLDQTFPGQTLWTEQHRLSGYTYAVVTLNLLFERFQGGIPQITAKIRGKKIHDPRTGQTAYSRNPALCLADFLQSEAGYLAAPDQIDENALIAAANACDQVVYGAASANDLVNYGGSQALYVCDGMFRSDQDRESTRQQLEDSMAGFSLESGGVWRIQAGAWSTPVLNLTDEDMLAPTAVVQTANPGASRFNGMRGTYVNAARNGVSEDFTPFQNPNLRALDAKDKFTDMALAFTGSHMRCHQIARVVVEQSRGGFVLRIHPKMRAWHLQPGDRIVLTSALYGFANKTFRVTDWTYSRNAPLSLLVIEDVPAYYDLADEVQADAAPNTNLPSPFLQPQAPLDLVVQSGEEQLVQQGGTLLVRAKVSWSASTDPAVLRNGMVRVQWRTIMPVGEWQTQDLPGNAVQTYLLGLAVHGEYQVRVRFMTPYAVSNWTTVTHRLQGPSEFPDDVAGLSLAVEQAGVIARWSAPTGLNLLDWGATQLRVGPSWEAGLEVFNGKALSANIGWLNAGTQKVWAAHANTQGIWGVPVAATIEILPPSQPIVHGEVWGAQIELAWQPCGTTQPISAYIVKVGPTLGEAVEIGRTGALNFVRTEPVAATRIYWVMAFDAAGNPSDAGYVELSSLPSIDDAIKELQEGLDEQVADLLNINSGISERLIDEAIERGTAITHVEKVVSDTTEQLAQRIDMVSARAVGYVRANLVFNGGFEFDLDRWQTDAQPWRIVEDDWGAAARLASNVPAQGRLASAEFPVKPGTWYAGSGDSLFESDVGRSGFALEFFDAAGNSLEVATNLKAGRHGFMNEQLRRNDFAVEAAAPASAAGGRFVFMWDGYVAGGAVGVRYLKVEQGRFPVTPFTSEASDRGAVAAVREEAAARATADAAEAAARSSLAARLGSTEVAVAEEKQARIDADGKLSTRWGIRLTADNKVSGVIMNNDGRESDFTVLVDKFAVAQQATNGSLRYPFVVGSVAGAATVGIDGTLVVDGSILARSINVDRLSAITARLGYVNAGQVDIHSDGAGGWGYLRSSGKWRDGNWGWLLAKHANGSTIVDFNLSGCGLVMHHEANQFANFRLWGPGFELNNGGLTISQLDVIGALNIRGRSVTVPTARADAGGASSIAHIVPDNRGASVTTYITGSAFIPAGSGGGAGGLLYLWVDNVLRWTGAGVPGSTISGAVVIDLAPGTHTISAIGSLGASSASIFALSCQR